MYMYAVAQCGKGDQSRSIDFQSNMTCAPSCARRSLMNSHHGQKHVDDGPCLHHHHHHNAVGSRKEKTHPVCLCRTQNKNLASSTSSSASGLCERRLHSGSPSTLASHGRLNIPASTVHGNRILSRPGEGSGNETKRTWPPLQLKTKSLLLYTLK